MKQFQRVRVNGYFPQGSNLSGKFVGQATFAKEVCDSEGKLVTEIRMAYIVELDSGFYSQDVNTYVSMLVVDPSCVDSK